jgi:hypothetical protein
LNFFVKVKKHKMKFFLKYLISQDIEGSKTLVYSEVVLTDWIISIAKNVFFLVKTKAKRKNIFVCIVKRKIKFIFVIGLPNVITLKKG